MIPTMILLGLILGRWPRVALIGAAIVWPLVLLGAGIGSYAPWPGVIAGGAVLGAINAFVGIAVHQAVLWGVRRMLSLRTRTRNSA